MPEFSPTLKLRRELQRLLIERQKGQKRNRGQLMRNVAQAWNAFELKAGLRGWAKRYPFHLNDTPWTEEGGQPQPLINPDEAAAKYKVAVTLTSDAQTSNHLPIAAE